MNTKNDISRIAVHDIKSNEKVIKANAGTFYPGMTLQDAKAIGRDKCFFRRDFYNLDKNGDNVLSKEEVMKEREREAKVLLGDSILMGLFAIAEVIYLCKSPKVANAAFTALATACSLSSLSSYKKKVKLNEEIKKEFFA